MFVDEAEIYIKGGDGGNGHMSFRREAHVPRGGPDGGDGGRGGSVIFEAVDNIDTLMDFVGHHHWKAENGRKGAGKNMTGRSGQDMIIPVPRGTLIYDKDSGLLLKDLVEDGDRACIGPGGKGGRGNARFATPTEQSPVKFEEGEKGTERNLKLELKLIADVGFVGLPNAGKSTLLSRVSQARPKIASYPFTTLHPILGIVELSRYRRMVFADLPGLIEGAHEGLGLGDDFLRHIERTRIIIHLVEVMPVDGSDPVQNYHMIRNELTSYSEALAGKPELLVANKIDLTGAEDAVAELQERLGQPILAISAVTGEGLTPLLERVWEMIEHQRELERINPPEKPKEFLEQDLWLQVKEEKKRKQIDQVGRIDLTGQTENSK